MVPPGLASGAGGWLGRRLGPSLYVESSRAALESLRRFRPQEPEPERLRALERMWSHVGRLQAETAVIDRIYDRAKIEIRNEASVRGALASKRPIVFVFAHLANWELLAVAVQRMGVQLNVVYEILPDPVELELALRARRRLGYRLIAPDRGGVRALLASLGRGEAVALAIDEFKHGNVVAPSLGRPRHPLSNAHFAVKLARRFEAPMIPAHCVRGSGLEFVLQFLDPIERPTPESLDALCESWIRAHPEQWYMLHRLRFR